MITIKRFLIVATLAATALPTTHSTSKNITPHIKANVLPEPIIQDQPLDESVSPKKSHDATRLSSRDRRLRKRKSKTTRHTISTMTYDELREAKNRKIKENNIEIAIKYAQKMLPLCKDMHEANDLTIELADLLFQHGDLEEAGKHYKEFAKMYPGYVKIEHAEHRSILCSFYGMLDATRDQTKTRETLDLTIKFLERGDVFTQFAPEVESIQKQCYARLIENEINILEFYLNSDKLKSAQVRIDGLRKDFAHAMNDLEPKLISYEIKVAQKQNDTALVEQKQLELQEKFPLYSQINLVVASADAKKTDFSQKF